MPTLIAEIILLTVESLTTSVAKGVKCIAAGEAGGLAEGGYEFQSGDLTIPVTFNGRRFTSDDAKASYKALTGEFSGSYKERYTSARGRTATRRVNFGGVVIDGVGYGTTKSGAVVTIAPDAE